MRIAVSFTIEVPDDSMPILYDLAAVEQGERTGARRFVQAEAEQNTISYLTDNGVRLRPIRGVALAADDYPPKRIRTGSNPSEAIR